MSTGEEFKVESCVVTPSVETPRHGLWLSPLDVLKANRGHTQTIYLYRPDSGGVDDFFDVARLKAAMAKALVPFYPLAGRLGMDADGHVEIDCAGQGVLFAVGYSDLTVDDLSNFGASPELTRLFVPRMEDSPSVMCAVQVTFLKCGGVTLGTALHHAAVDGFSAFHFFQTWSSFSRDGNAAALDLPCHDRTLLRARSPPFVHPDALTMFRPKLPPCELPPTVHVVNEIFSISKDQVAALKRACTGGSGAVSTFCVVTAHVWRCLCTSRRLPPDTMTHLGFSANIRRSLRPPLPDTYFGNAIITLGAAGKAQDIIASEDNQPLASVVSRIRGAITRMDDELVRSAVDHMELEMAGSLPAILVGNNPLTDLWVVSWLGMPMYDADFGWGRPTVIHRAAHKNIGVAHLLDGQDGSLCILVALEHMILDDFRRLLYADMPTQPIKL
ncbi:unnamed protein product [Alopecurus aequalis]